MMNKTNKTNRTNGATTREQRMEILRQNGISTDNFFDLSMRVPFGAEVKVVVDGKEVAIDKNGQCCKCDEDFNAMVAMASKYGVQGLVDALGSVTVAKAMEGCCKNEKYEEDHMIQQIKDSGYIYNAKTDGRWVAAQTFRMLNAETRRYDNRGNCIKEYGWNAALRNGYSHMYQFEMMIDEFHRLAKMEKERDKDFHVLSKFFTKGVAVETCEHYLYELKKWLKSQKTKKHNRRPYVTLIDKKFGYNGMIHVDELEEVLYRNIEHAIYKLSKVNMYDRKGGGYYGLEKAMREFVKVAPVLPYYTPKCSVWKDAFKANGAFKTLNNIIKHHGCVVECYETGEILDRDEALKYVYDLIHTYKADEYWKYHELLKRTITINNFDLFDSIKEGNRGIVEER